jgi:Skp family chaperone for outer membrane proteins
MDQYTKISDNQVQIVKTVEVTETFDIAQALSDKTAMQANIDAVKKRCDDEVATIQAKIDDIDAKLAQAQKVGIDVEAIANPVTPVEPVAELVEK